MCVYEGICEEQRLTSGIFLDCCLPYVLGRVSQLNPELNSSTYFISFLALGLTSLPPKYWDDKWVSMAT